MQTTFHLGTMFAKILYLYLFNYVNPSFTSMHFKQVNGLPHPKEYESITFI